MNERPGDEVMARSSARVHWRTTSWSGLTVCGLDVSGLANGYDGAKCLECFPVRQKIMDLAASGRHDAVDLALDVAFPSQRTELETIRDKVNGHLEAARARRAGHTPAREAYYRADAAVTALEALARDLGHI